MNKEKDIEDMAERIGKAVAEAENAQVEPMKVRIGMLEHGLRELYAAVDGGSKHELAEAMNLARGLLMDAGEFDTDVTS